MIEAASGWILLLTRAALCAACAAGPAFAGEEVVRGATGERIDAFMTAASRLGMEGTLLVEKDGELILHKGYGIADRGSHVPAGVRTVYVLGSLSKQFTAAAILKLAEQGRLSLGDSLARWFPDAPADKRAITLDQLLHHTSGLPYQHAGGLRDTMSTAALVTELLGYPLSFAPGERYQYSNPGYNLLGVVIERASGVRFGDYLRSTLFGPAGMTETGFVDEPARWPAAQCTPSYSGSDADDPPLFPLRRAPKMMGDGSVVSTTGDLWKWELALRAHTVLDTASTRRLFAPGPVSGAGSRYACGWQVVQSQRHTTVIMHGGDLGGFNSDMRRLVDEGATLIFLSNARESGRGYSEVIPFDVTRLVFGPAPVLPAMPKPIGPTERARFSGRWRLEPDTWVVGRAGTDAVRVLAESQGALSALAGSDSSARSREAQMDSVAACVVDTLLHGNLPALETRFHPALVPAAHPEFFSFWKREADSLGGAPRVEVLGTASPDPVSGRSWVRLRGVHGDRVLSLDWVQGRLIGSQPVREGGLELEFFLDAGDSLVRYDLWTGRNVRVRRAG